MALPDDLPPTSLDITPKLILYFGILYIITTAITAWIITRRRSFPKTKKRETREEETSAQTEMRPSRPMTFDDTQDTLSGLKVQVEASESALAKLRSLHDSDEISETAYSKLSDQYTKQVNNLTEQINNILQSDIESSSGEIIAGVKDEDIDELEADLEKQLMDLEDDDSFLRPRPKKSLEDALHGEKRAPSQPSPPTSQPTAKAPEPPASQPSAQAPTPPRSSSPRAPTPPSSQPSGPTQPTASQPSVPGTKIPSPSSQKQEPTPSPATPAAESGATPPVPKSSGPKAQPDKGSTPSSIPSPTSTVKPSAPSPPPPPESKSQPAAQTTSQPTPQTPQPTQPEEQISAEQPMKVDAEDDGMFAKSTSIAALRMDMLRELARLKKLIDEDE